MLATTDPQGYPVCGSRIVLYAPSLAWDFPQVQAQWQRQYHYPPFWVLIGVERSDACSAQKTIHDDQFLQVAWAHVRQVVERSMRCQ